MTKVSARGNTTSGRIPPFEPLDLPVDKVQGFGGADVHFGGEVRSRLQLIDF